MVEDQLALTAVAQQFRLQNIPDHTLEPEGRLTLRSHDGLPMIFQRM